MNLSIASLLGERFCEHNYSMKTNTFSCYENIQAVTDMPEKLRLGNAFIKTIKKLF